MKVPNPITPAELHDICRTIYGYGYQTQLARDLDMMPDKLRTVQRWFAGDCPMPAAAIVALRHIVSRKQPTINRLKGMSLLS